MKTGSIIFFIALTLSLQTKAQTTTTHQVPLTGKAKEVNVAKDNKAVQQLSKKNYTKNKPLIDTILKHPNDYNPVVFYTLSAVLFKADKKDEAAFWFYVAQLRARYDFNRCNDGSTAGTIAVLNSTFGPPINQYAIKNLDTLEKMIGRVIDFVKNNQENYDQRWINLDGMGVMTASLGGKDDIAMSKPEDAWPAIKAETLKTYYEGFQEAMESMRKKN